MADWNVKDNPLCLRVIKTARDIDSINECTKSGFIPLIRKVLCSPKIGSHIDIYQNKKTGEIFERNTDAYNRDIRIGDFEKVIENIYHYPYNFKSPYAAYLIPNDLFIGQKVFLEDLIEDFEGNRYNGSYGNSVERAICAEAIWDGNELEILTSSINWETAHLDSFDW